MSARKRRTPLGTQPPIDTHGDAQGGAHGGAHGDELVDASGEILVEPRPAAPEAEHAHGMLSPDQEHTVIVELDAGWLARLELPPD